MAVKRTATSQLRRPKDLDFRSPNDEAWYSVRLLKVTDDVLRVMYLHFPEDSDEWFINEQFDTLDQIHELAARFRIPAQQLQDSQCRQLAEGKVVVACLASSTDELKFYDALVDSVSRSEHKSNSASEEQVCTCKFHVTWKYGPMAGKHATVSTAAICLIQDLPVDDPVLEEFIDSARRSLYERMANLANQAQGGISAFSTVPCSHSSSPHSANVPEVIDIKSSDSSHHHEEVEQSYEATKPQYKSGAEASTELASKGLTNGQKRCFFFWVDNMDENTDPPKVVKFLQRELSVPSQVVLFPNLFLGNTLSGAIYVESGEHANRVLKLLSNPNNIIASSAGRPWVTNERCCGIFHYPMPWQEMNLDNESQDDAAEIRVLCPGSKGYEEASKMRDLFKEHYDRIERLQGTLRSKELELRNSLANGSRSSK